MNNNLEKIRHSLAHILAHAVKELYPQAKLGMGPAIKDGFYYDFDGINIDEESLPKIEKKMKEIVKRNISFEKKVVSREEAKKLF